MTRSLTSWRIRFGLFVAVQLALIHGLQTGDPAGDMLSTLALFGGVLAFAAAPVIAGMGVSYCVFGTIRFLPAAAVALAGFVAMPTLNNDVFLLVMTLALGTLLTALGKLISLLGAATAALALADGRMPSLGSLSAAAAAYTPEAPFAEAVFIAALIAIPLLADPIAERLGA